MRYFLTLNNLTDTTLVSNKMRAVWACSLITPLSYIVLALSPAVTNLSDKTLIFLDFQGPTIKFHDFPDQLENEILKFHDFPDQLENEILKFHDFPGFPWSVRTWFIGTTKTKNKNKRKGNQLAPAITGWTWKW